MFYVGLDLGQTQDYTAVAVLERREGRRIAIGESTGRHGVRTVHAPTPPPSYACVHLQRYALGTSYPRVVDLVRALLATPNLHGARLIVDGTGVGAPVVDLLRRERLDPVPVLITSGDAVTEEEGRWRVPKRDLAGVLQVLLQTRRLKVAEALPEAKVLAAEMEAFQVKVTAAASDVYGSWREGAHDDLVLAVALACWWAERNPPREWIVGPPERPEDRARRLESEENREAWRRALDGVTPNAPGKIGYDIFGNQFVRRDREE